MACVLFEAGADPGGSLPGGGKVAEAVEALRAEVGKTDADYELEVAEAFADCEAWPERWPGLESPMRQAVAALAWRVYQAARVEGDADNRERALTVLALAWGDRRCRLDLETGFAWERSGMAKEERAALSALLGERAVELQRAAPGNAGREGDKVGSLAGIEARALRWLWSTALATLITLTKEVAHLKRRLMVRGMVRGGCLHEDTHERPVRMAAFDLPGVDRDRPGRVHPAHDVEVVPGPHSAVLPVGRGHFARPNR